MLIQLSKPGIACKSETLRSLYSHVLLFPAESFKSKNLSSAWTNASLEIPQLAHIRLAQWDPRTSDH